MKPKTIIKLVYLVGCFIFWAFVEKDGGLAKLALSDIKNLDAE